MVRRFLLAQGHHWDMEMFANYFGELSERWTFLGHRVILRAFLISFESKSIEARCVRHVGRRPAVRTMPNVSG